LILPVYLSWTTEELVVKVLLNQDVAGLGRAGETKEVADGYARNFLLARGLATLASEGALKQAAERKDVAQRREAKKKAEVGSLATTLSQTQVVFKAKVGEQHRLYGSITAADVAEEIGRQIGQVIDKRNVELGEPIRHLGTYKVPVRLGPKVLPAVTVVVEPE
jgi:large subunit ribosomal protein L9